MPAGRRVGLPETAQTDIARRRAGTRSLIEAPPDPVREQRVAEPTQAGSGGTSLEAPTLETAKLVADPNNPIGRLEDVDDIASTIDTVGILHALDIADRDVYLRRYPEHAGKLGDATHVVIDGCRRLTAAAIKGLPEVPVNLRNDLVEDGRDHKTRIIANLRRKDLSPLDEAREFSKLLAIPGATHRSVADEVGCGHTNITKKLKLLELAPAVQDAVQAGKVTATDGYELAVLDDHDDQVAAYEMMTKGRKVKNAVAAVRAERERAQAEPVDAADLRAQAVAARDEVCVKLVANLPDTEEQLRYVAAHAVRGASSHAATVQLAHRWLRAAGIGPALDNPSAYVAASMHSREQLATLAYAVALAADELHARDERRDTWDIRAVDHHRRMLAAGYAATEWDAAHLPAN